MPVSAFPSQQCSRCYFLRPCLVVGGAMFVLPNENRESSIMCCMVWHEIKKSQKNFTTQRRRRRREGTEERERQRCSRSALVLTSYITCSMYQLHITTQCVHWTWAESLHTCFSAQCLLWIQDIFSLVADLAWAENIHKAMTVITLKHLKQLYLLADLQLFDFSFMLYWLHTDLGDSSETFSYTQVKADMKQSFSA